MRTNTVMMGGRLVRRYLTCLRTQNVWIQSLETTVSYRTKE